MLLCIRFMVVDIIMTSAVGQDAYTAGNCPNWKGIVLINRLADGSRGDWMAYHQPAIERGEAEDKGMLHLGRIMAAPGDTLWYDNKNGLIDSKPSTQFQHPLIVPAKGQKLDITDDNIRFYAITIMLHEPSKVCIIDDSLCVSGKMVDSYTFSQDYFWIHNVDTLHQPDSRSFGFVPYKSLIGKVVTTH